MSKLDKYSVGISSVNSETYDFGVRNTNEAEAEALKSLAEMLQEIQKNDQEVSIVLEGI